MSATSHPALSSEPDLSVSTATKVPTAPELGLFLHECVYHAYNQRFGEVHGTLTMDDFQTLPSDAQSDQIFKLLAILSPLANEVCDLKYNIGEMLGKC